MQPTPACSSAEAASLDLAEMGIASIIQPGPNREKAGLWLLIFNLVLVSGLLAWLPFAQGHPYRDPVTTLVFIATNLSLSLLSLWVSQTGATQGRAQLGWLLIALGSLSNGLGDGLWLALSLQGQEPFPSIADAFYLAFYPCMFGGILQFIRPPEGRMDRYLFWIDLGITLASAATLMWYFQLRALVETEHQASFEAFLSLAYPLGSTMLLVGIGFWLIRPRATPRTWVRYGLLAGVLTFLFADLGYTVQQATDQYSPGGLVDTLYYLSLLTLMVSAYLAIRDEGRPGIPQISSVSRTLVVVPYLGIGAVYGLLIATALGWTPPYLHLSHWDQHRALIVLSWVGALVTALSLLRQAISARETAHLRAQRAIEQRERRFAALARHSSDLILLLDVELRPQFISQSFERLLGWKPVAGEGSFFELLHPEDQARAAKQIARALLKPEVPLEATWRLRRADGNWRDFEILITNLIQNPAVGGLVLNGRDVTERQRYEQALEKARAAAETANRAKDLFLANMSHEIRTPLQAILGFIELLLASALNPQQRDYLERMQAAGQSLLALLNDILDYSKIESGRLHLESLPLTIQNLFERSRSLFEIQARRKGLSLGFSIAPDVPGELIGDPLRLLQILNNLVGNAIKFTPQGGVWVEASCIEQTRDSALLEFRVRDTGIGMTPKQIEQIFHPFRQGDPSTSRRYGGSGLGLSICRRLVELMGGEIGVESEPGEGSTFWFRVRLERVVAEFETKRPKPDRLPATPGADLTEPSQGAEYARPALPLPGHLQARLKELTALLDANNSRARHLSRALLAELQGTAWQADYEPIAQAIAELDFDSARQGLGHLIDKTGPARAADGSPGR